VEDREFWTEFRRWLIGRQKSDQKMIDAIEQRFGPFGEQRLQERQERRPTPARA
jgi:hypothetical protein